MSPRAVFFTLAIVLGIVLIALVAYLLWLLRPADITQRGGTETAGLEPVLALYGPGQGDKPTFSRPMAAAWGNGGRIYVADTQNNRVVVFDRDGRYRYEFGGFGVAKPSEGATATWKPGRLNYPTGIATDPANGDVYVADFYNDSISVFDAEGKFLRRFPDPTKVVGRGGSGAQGKGIAVTALTVEDGKVYATDTYQILVFDTSGNLIRQFGMPGSNPGQLDHPNGIAVDFKGRIYVSDSNHNRVTAFSPEGTVLWSTGEQLSELMQQTNNPFILPRGLTVLRDGTILVADPLGQQLVRLSENGEVIATYGTRGEALGELNFPNSVASRRDLVLIADRQNDRVQVVRLTSK